MSDLAGTFSDRRDRGRDGKLPGSVAARSGWWGWFARVGSICRIAAERKCPSDLPGCFPASHCENRKGSVLKNSPPPRASAKRFAAAVAGAIVGFGLTFVLYSWLNPILEARTDWMRELQGLLFTMVLLSTVVGAAVGWAMSRPKNRTPARLG
jgi:hypothetical protein